MLAMMVRPFPRFRYALLVSAILLAGQASAQVAGNVGYGQAGGRARAQANEHGQHVLTKEELPPDATSMFVDADVLMNVKADEYVAVFGITQEGSTVEEADTRMDALVKQFTAALKPLHIRDSDIFVDFISQPRVYGYDLSENIAREKLAGFEVKKNVSVHYADRNLLDKLMLAASKVQIYDLIKVDYVVRDVSTVQAQLMNEAAAIIQGKLARDQKLLGVKVQASPAVYAERPAIYYPTEMYDSYTAAESENVRPINTSRYTVQQMRKTRTFYFNPLDGNGFDKVINPVVLEPVVQFTLYLKVKYEVAH